MTDKSTPEVAANTDIRLFTDASGAEAHRTVNGALGISVGGYVYVKPLAEWHALAGGKWDGLKRPEVAAMEPCRAALQELVRALSRRPPDTVMKAERQLDDVAAALVRAKAALAAVSAPAQPVAPDLINCSYRNEGMWTIVTMPREKFERIFYPSLPAQPADERSQQ